MATKKDFTLKARWGNGTYWTLPDASLPDGLRLDIGETIQNEGAGKAGASMVPWVLSHYERVMRLRPIEAWLLARYLAHSWQWRGLAWPSLSKIEDESVVERRTLGRVMKRLQELGYVYLVAGGDHGDRRVRYDVSGALAALALCIFGDGASKWAMAHGGPLTEQEVRRKTHTVHLPDGSNKDIVFDLDFEALRKLTERKVAVTDE